MGTKDGDALTIQVDHGEFKALLTCTAESVAVNLVIQSDNGREVPLANYMVQRVEVRRMDLLLSGIEAWSKELFQQVLAERGESIASLQQKQNGSTQ